MKSGISSLLLLVPLLAQDPKAAFDRGDYRTAIELFERANQARPDCANLFYVGLAKYRLNRTAEALISFRAAIQCNPKMAAAHLALGEANEAKGNNSEALAAYLDALKNEPSHPMALRGASNLYLKAGLHDKALPLLETLVKAAPKLAGVHADLGAVYAASGNRVASEAAFRKALQLEPNYFPALSGLGNLLARAGDNEVAMPLLRKAVQSNPNAYEGHFLLGSALNRLSEFTEARAEIEKAIQLGGANEPQVFYQLARACGGLGDAAQRKLALAKFSELTRKEKDSAELKRQSVRWIDEARTLLQNNDLENAAKRLELAREATPGDATLLFRLASLNFDLLRFDPAREYVQAAISISPATWLYHYLLGLIEKSSNHLNEAKASLELAVKLNDKEGGVFNALGEVVLEQGDRKSAIAYFEKATRLSPTDPRFRENLAFAKR